MLDPEDEGAREKRRPDSGVFEVIANTLRRSFGMDLLGIDVVMENSSGRYAIIDVNAYPGEFFLKGRLHHHAYVGHDSDNRFVPWRNKRNCIFIFMVLTR